MQARSTRCSLGPAPGKSPGGQQAARAAQPAQRALGHTAVRPYGRWSWPIAQRSRTSSSWTLLRSAAGGRGDIARDHQPVSRPFGPHATRVCDTAHRKSGARCQPRGPSGLLARRASRQLPAHTHPPPPPTSRPPLTHEDLGRWVVDMDGLEDGGPIVRDHDLLATAHALREWARRQSSEVAL